ncbi:MAG: ABC transporter ATP-binding protein [Candidatus Dormibacteria bacterium]
MLQVEALSVRYGAIQAVRGIDLEISEGECVSLLGANGAGKSSSLKALSGLMRPATGRVVFESRVVTGLPAHQMAQMGVTLVPEGRQIFATLTVRENLELGGFNQPPEHNRVDLARVLETFPQLGTRLDALAGNLSGGEQQMLALGRALMSRPKLLMLDEPSLGLAPLVASQIFEVIRSIAESGIAVLLVEQNVHRALGVASRGYVLELGEIALQGNSADLLANEHVRLAYLGHGMGEGE